MITRRIWINLISFVVLSSALVAYGFLDLLGNPLASTTSVSAVLPSASGLADNFLVTLDGVDVGSVSGVSLVPDGAKISMTLNPGTKVPNDVSARITVANALGQQEVELLPAHNGPAPSLRNGDVIPAAADSLPADVGTVVAEATKLLQSIPAGDLNTVISQLAVALNDNGGNLRTIAQASEQFSQEFLAFQQQFESLVDNAPSVLDTISADAKPLQQGLADTAVLAQVLATHSPDLVNLLSQGTSAATDLNDLVVQNEPNLACLVHDLSDVNANLAQPTNLSNLSTSLATAHNLFDAVAGVAPTGPAKALTTSDHARTDQEWLRTRLLIPPPLTTATTYVSARTLPAVLPGAACSTEYGQGVGAAMQPNFKPVGAGAHVVAPTAAQAHVSGTGSATTGSTAPALAQLPAPDANPGLSALPIVAALAMMGWVLTLGRRRPVRSARALRVTSSDKTRRSR